MAEVVLNIAFTSTVLSLVLWLSKSNPSLSGFIVSLPLSTLIVLAFSKIQSGEPGNTFLLAKSIFVGVPSTLLFFIPFLLADKLKLTFWSAYFVGLFLLGASYGVHKWVMRHWMAS